MAGEGGWCGELEQVIEHKRDGLLKAQSKQSTKLKVGCSHKSYMTNEISWNAVEKRVIQLGHVRRYASGVQFDQAVGELAATPSVHSDLHIHMHTQTHPLA